MLNVGLENFWFFLQKCGQNLVKAILDHKILSLNIFKPKRFMLLLRLIYLVLDTIFEVDLVNKPKNRALEGNKLNGKGLNDLGFEVQVGLSFLDQIGLNKPIIEP